MESLLKLIDLEQEEEDDEDDSHQVAAGWLHHLNHSGLSFNSCSQLSKELRRNVVGPVG